MITINTYFIIALALVGFILTIVGHRRTRKYPHDDAAEFLGGVIIAVAIIWFGLSLISPVSFTDIPMCNDGRTIVKVRYLKYHPFTENTLETDMLMPGQAKVLRNAKIVSQNELKIDEI